MRKSPSMQGLRFIFRKPILGLAEIAWRWTSATIAGLLFCFLLFEYLDSLPVTKGDMLLLGSGVPSLALGALERILLSGSTRFLVAAAICFFAISITWVFAASAGRAATIRVLLDQAAHDQPSETSAALAPESRHSFAAPSTLVSKPVVLLHFCRAALLLGTLAAFIGAIIMAGFTVSTHDPHPGLAILLFLLLSGVIAMLWYGLDWLLSAASIFAIRDDETAWAAISGAVTFACQNSGALVRSTGLFNAIHLVIFFAATSLLSAPLALARIFSPGAIFISILAMTLLYFASVDFLRVARLAAYICIAHPKSGKI